MARITQLDLFLWKEIDDLRNLERLQLVINHMPDEKLMIAIEKKRKKGRNDSPVRAIWNSILVGVVYQHASNASLIRDLERNSKLRQMCGFDIIKDQDSIPSPSAYTHF